MKPSASHTLAELVAQHDTLRGLMDECEDLADHLDAHPDSDPEPLTLGLAKLRLSLDVHNRFEESLLRPILEAQDPHAGSRVARMVEDHTEEHRMMRERLGSPATAQLRDTIETLRAHLEAEERYLLTPHALRDHAAARSSK